MLSQIVQMVANAQRSRAPIQKYADKVAGLFVPVVIGIAITAFIVWGIWGPDPALAYGLVSAVAVLIIACPCALGLATPMSIMTATGTGAQMGVLIKNAESLERFEKVEQVVPKMEGTLEVKEARDIMWEPNQQFRVLNGEQFAWVYVSLDKRAMETTGFQDAEISFCLEVLLELPNVAEVIDEKNQRRLNELEKAGLI